jgi:SAM-dependent methyltransferase|tara:strand:- start:4259 stop:4906 length:648 start_codon:yes stop_codon:yes gene_type:complete
MDEARERMLQIFHSSSESDDPLSWFEEIYTKSDLDRDLIPWDWREPHPFLVEWAQSNPGRGRALVVGCGLGEDAAFLSKIGWEVTAFDVSKSAVDWAKELHSDTPVKWLVEDLLCTPDSWNRAFDLVVEVHIIQAIPREISKSASEKLAPLVSKEGHLICIGRIRENEEEAPGPPWPLSIDFIEEIGRDLESVELKQSKIEGKESNRYRAVWRRR